MLKAKFTNDEKNRWSTLLKLKRKMKYIFMSVLIKQSDSVTVKTTWIELILLINFNFTRSLFCFQKKKEKF